MAFGTRHGKPRLSREANKALEALVKEFVREVISATLYFHGEVIAEVLGASVQDAPKPKKAKPKKQRRPKSPPVVQPEQPVAQEVVKTPAPPVNEPEVAITEEPQVEPLLPPLEDDSATDLGEMSDAEFDHHLEKLLASDKISDAESKPEEAVEAKPEAVEANKPKERRRERPAKAQGSRPARSLDDFGGFPKLLPLPPALPDPFVVYAHTAPAPVTTVARQTSLPEVEYAELPRWLDPTGFEPVATGAIKLRPRAEVPAENQLTPDRMDGTDDEPAATDDPAYADASE